MNTNKAFGQFLRKRREELQKDSSAFSLRKVAKRLNIQPSYISKVERGDVSPPSEATIIRWAADLMVDSDVLLALAGKVSQDLREVILKRPKLFAELLRDLKNAPDHALLHIVREVRDGEW